jgi:hypothetical protein
MVELAMIPDDIAREHILKAIEYIDENGVPQKRQSTRYDLIYREKRYPPKYVLSIANKYVNGEELDSRYFYGGERSNGFLRERGFEIVHK